MVHGGKAKSLRLRLVIKAVKRDAMGLTGDLDARDAPSKLPMVRRQMHVRTVVSKDGPTRGRGPGPNGHGSPGWAGHQVPTHAPIRRPADSADLKAATNGESERVNPARRSRRAGAARRAGDQAASSRGEGLPEKQTRGVMPTIG